METPNWQKDYQTALFGKWHLGMFKERYAPWRRGFNTTLGYLQGCESAWTHIAACCGAHTATGDQGYVCGWGGSKDYRGYDWFEDGRAALAANGTNSAELLRAGATAFYKARPAAGSDPANGPGGAARADAASATSAGAGGAARTDSRRRACG